MRDDEVSGKSEVREGFSSRIRLLEKFIFWKYFVATFVSLMELELGAEGMWEVAITHFVLTADPDTVGRPSGTSAF